MRTTLPDTDLPASRGLPCNRKEGITPGPREYFTEERFKKLVRTIEDAEEEVIGMRG
jgi:hypothetical protein